MMSADHEYSGDYGYDLVHEVRAALQQPATRRRVPRVSGASTRTPGTELDVDGDFGYDQAHEL
jgi:hypothetical protein